MRRRPMGPRQRTVACLETTGARSAVQRPTLAFVPRLARTRAGLGLEALEGRCKVVWTLAVRQRLTLVFRPRLTKAHLPTRTPPVARPTQERPVEWETAHLTPDHLQEEEDRRSVGESDPARLHTDLPAGLISTCILNYLSASSRTGSLATTAEKRA